MGNELYRSSWATTSSCAGTSLVVHGEHDNLLIEGNLVREDVGAAGQGCWGITVDPAYPNEAEGFTNVTVRGNTIINVGNTATGMESCADCVIENNVIVHEQDFQITGIAVPN